MRRSIIILLKTDGIAFHQIQVHTASLNHTPLKPLTRHDIESWFYTLLYIATDAHLGWRHHHSVRGVRNSKLALLGQCWDEQRAAILPDFKSVVEDLHAHLFEVSGSFKSDVGWQMVLRVLDDHANMPT